MERGATATAIITITAIVTMLILSALVPVACAFSHCQGDGCIVGRTIVAGGRSSVPVHQQHLAERRRFHQQRSALSAASGAGEEECVPKSRRVVMQQIVTAAGGASSALLFGVPTTNAIMTDETTSFANPSTDASYRQQSPQSTTSSTSSSLSVPNKVSDEISFTIYKPDLQNMQGGLGLELTDISFRTNFRVVIKSVAPNSLAEKLGIQPGWVVVSVNGADAERTNAAGVAIYFSRAVKALLNDASPTASGLVLTFRDPSKFRNELENFPTTSGIGSDEDGIGAPAVSTKVAPAGDTTQRNTDGSIKPGASVTEQSDQIVTITQLVPPKLCRRRATTNDLLEISYVGKVLETGAIFDGSAVKINGEAIPGRGNDISVFFVLGKQPFGQFPPGWDVGLDGMCVGERRRLIIPPVLAYGSVGVPRRGIPPNATLQYDVTLVSLNGLATPQ